VSLSFFDGKTVLITGASSGIGEELAWQLAQAGAHLTLTARRADVLAAVARRIAATGRPEPLVVPCDVTRDGDVERAVAESLHRWGTLDIVIANAGFGVVGAIRDLSVNDYRRQFETNVFGVLRSYYATRRDLEATRGTFVIIGSVSGHLAMPGGAPYAMSKFAVRALAESLRHEEARRGVAVVLISPGFVESEIRQVDNAGVHHPDVVDAAPSRFRMPAEMAARQIVGAVARRRREAVITGHGKLAVFAVRHLPALVHLAIGKLGVRRRGAPADAPQTPGSAR
jgi:short-subunit dehydrogenase